MFEEVGIGGVTGGEFGEDVGDHVGAEGLFIGSGEVWKVFVGWPEGFVEGFPVGFGREVVHGAVLV